MMNRKQVAAIALAAWLTIIAAGMLVIRRFDLEIFFVLALLGVMVLAELTWLKYVQPRYQRYLGYLIWAGIIVFAAIAATKVMEILTA